jgi:hypothetical protein
MDEKIIRTLWRFFRSLVAIIIAGIAVQYSDNQIFILVAPVLQALSKYWREEYGLDIKIF